LRVLRRHRPPMREDRAAAVDDGEILMLETMLCMP